METEGEDLPYEWSPETDHEIIYDYEYTEEILTKYRARYGSDNDLARNAIHATDLIFCLRKARGRKQNPKPMEISDELTLTWAGGLEFEDRLESLGVYPASARQKAMVYCWHCKAVSGQPARNQDGTEVAKCTVCNNYWIVGTPDYVLDGIVHETKETRKSRKNGPAAAPWWIDQVRTYLLFLKRGGRSDAPYARLIIKWLMGDYGSKKKGEQPRGPQTGLDAFKVVFHEGFEDHWDAELVRRLKIVTGKDVPELSVMSEGKTLSPCYDWECDSCDVGLDIDGEGTPCENFRWDKDGKLREVEPVKVELEEIADEVSASPKVD
ncbi:hypothetical protein LCGC14_2038670 [marine sediment metagenome]|uniref:PD-(D/E)XK endonuclease-like domain-containing protein n=1 Tax=marine sediment metagenome TaxID=412755 RepID=A0A0F9H5Z8_9ZZZZ